MSKNKTVNTEDAVKAPLQSESSTATVQNKLSHKTQFLKVFNIIKHMVFWSLAIPTFGYSTFWGGMILFTLEYDKYHAGAYLNTLIVLPALLILPIATAVFVFITVYIKKRKISFSKILFGEVFPIILLCLLTLLTCSIDSYFVFSLGQMAIILLFYIITAVRLAIFFKPELDPLHILRSIFDTVQAAISLYMTLILVFPGILALLFALLRNSISLSYNDVTLSISLFVGFIAIVTLPSFFSLRSFIRNFRTNNIYAIILTAVLFLLPSVGIVYINENYDPTIKEFNKPEYVKLISEKDYDKKREIKKEITGKYSLESFLDLEVVDIEESYNLTISAKEVSDAIFNEICFGSNTSEEYSLLCKKYKTDFINDYAVYYRHLLSYLLPLESPESKKDMLYKIAYSIYDMDVIDYSFSTSTDKNLTANIIVSETSETESTYSSVINIDIDNNSSVNKQFILEFTLPDNTVITNLHSGHDGIINDSQLVPRNVGEVVYQEEIAKTTPTDPTTLTNIYGNTYMLKVYPVLPNSSHEVVISYKGIKGLSTTSAIPHINQSNAEVTLKPATKSAPDLENYINMVPTSTSNYYFEDSQYTYMLASIDKNKLHSEMKSGILFVVDTSYSMRKAYQGIDDKPGLSDKTNTPWGIYTLLKQRGLNATIYGTDNGVYKMSEYNLENLSRDDLYGYSDRKTAFTQLFKEHDIAGNRWHVVYITDSSDDLAFEDVNFKDNTYSIINGVSLPYGTEILSLNVIELTNNKTSGLDNIMKKFIEDNNGNIHLTDPKAASAYSYSSTITSIEENIRARDYMQNKEGSDIVHIYPLSDNQRALIVMTNTNKATTDSTIKKLLLDSVSYNALKCSQNQCGEFKLIAKLLETRAMSNAFNFRNNTEQRLYVGDDIYAIGLENSILVPYTSFIVIETDEQQKSLEIGMRDKDKYDYSGSVYNLTYTGESNIWVLLLISIGVSIFAILCYIKPTGVCLYKKRV